MLTQRHKNRKLLIHIAYLSNFCVKQGYTALHKKHKDVPR